MVVLLNGAAGGWDELAIALVALGVLWVAVKLAGRKSAGQGGDEEDADELADEEHRDSARPPARPRD